jgi:hypothetical protein
MTNSPEEDARSRVIFDPALAEKLQEVSTPLQLQLMGES